MSSELEESAEAAAEVIQEELAHSKVSEAEMKWIGMVAISTMVMALFSAMGALMAGITANEAMLARTSEILTELKVQTDRLEADLFASNLELISVLGAEEDEAKLEQIKRLREEEEALSETVKEEEEEVGSVMEAHERFAIGVTLLSVAVTLSGMAVVSLRRRIWHCALLIALLGGGFVAVGLVSKLAG